MEIDELRALKSFIEQRFSDWPETPRILLANDGSPNPSCFLEINGNLFAHMRFWANNEYSIEAVVGNSSEPLMMASGTVRSLAQANIIAEGFALIAAAFRSPDGGSFE